MAIFTNGTRAAALAAAGAAAILVIVAVPAHADDEAIGLDGVLLVADNDAAGAAPAVAVATEQASTSDDAGKRAGVDLNAAASAKVDHDDDDDDHDDDDDDEIDDLDDDDGPGAARKVFSEQHRTHVRQFLQKHTDNCPEGLVTKETGCAPSESERLWSLGKPLADTIALRPIPDGLDAELPKAGPGYAYAFINGDVVLYRKDTRVVIDAVSWDS